MGIVRGILIAVSALAALVVAVLGLTYVLLVPSRPDLTDAERLSVPPPLRGSFVRLEDGVTHVKTHGPGDAPVVVLVHGFATASYIFDDLAEILAASGFRVLTYDLYGRGLSDRVRPPYDLALYLRQLNGLLTDHVPDRPVHLVGYSFGGTIAAAFAAAHPSQLTGVTFLAPAGLGPAPSGAGAALFSVMTAPGIGEWMMNALGPRLMGAQVRQNFRKAPGAEGLLIGYDQQERFAGFYPALLSTLRATPVLGGGQPLYASAVATGLPVSAIWAENDAEVPLAQADLLKEIAPKIEIAIVPDADHTMPYVKPKVVANILKDTLPQHDSFTLLHRTNALQFTSFIITKFLTDYRSQQTSTPARKHFFNVPLLYIDR